ncbi:DUF5996 family protein [Streptosporangium sp. NPDC020145]|uniref:DUF5996 family protein n=1 Tax=unclassified Streptosporangium TaxID=2632669 RepID=UPI00342EDBEA
MDTTEWFPAMPLQEWESTKETLHRFTQIVGKVRLAESTRHNHWWNVPFHLTGRGITTRPSGGFGGAPVFTIDFDFVAHTLAVNRLDGRGVTFSLVGHSVASFYRTLFEVLEDLGVTTRIEAEPFGLTDATPFAQDAKHADYDPALVNRYWRVLTQVGLVLDRFAAGFCGKVSPVHHFWHTFDIAVTRFSGRPAGPQPQADPVTREAYSREVISSGFWFGDEAMPWPAFYSYTAPEPEGLAGEPLRPEQAAWLPQRGSHLAVLRYDDARAHDDPVATVLDFLDSAYQAGARRAGWNGALLISPPGVTDALLEEEP